MDTVKLEKDQAGEWRWKRQDEGNHKITGASSEGYHNRQDAFDNAYDQFGDTVEYAEEEN